MYLFIPGTTLYIYLQLHLKMMVHRQNIMMNQKVLNFALKYFPINLIVEGMFLHKPFGQQTSPNATPCAIATPTPEHPPQQTKITLNAGVGTPKTLISTPTSSALSSTPYPQTMVQRLPPSTPISAVLNGMSSTGSATTHYIVQQPTQTPQSSQQTFVSIFPLPA